MKLENLTDLQTWAVEQWGDAKLGDRRTQRAIAIGAAIAANPQGSLPEPEIRWSTRLADLILRLVAITGYVLGCRFYHPVSLKNVGNDKVF